MASLSAQVKSKFRAKRYMDDILLLMLKDETWDHDRFYEDFQRSECYMAPLKLEEAQEGTFLETTFTVQGGHIRFRLKNVNEGGKNVWRYQAYDSYQPYTQKWSTLVATLKKVAGMAGDEREEFESALHKLREFTQLGYPMRVRRRACYKVRDDTGRMLWGEVAQTQY